jgi:hypothetical protein
MHLPTAINDSGDLAYLMNNTVPATAEDAAETPRDWLAGLWVSGNVYPLDPGATTETRAVLANGTAAVAWSPKGAYCGTGGHRTAVESDAAHWCPADTDAWTEEEDARGVTRDWRSVYVWDANGYSQTTVHGTIEAARAAFEAEVAGLKATGEQVADA